MTTTARSIICLCFSPIGRLICYIGCLICSNFAQSRACLYDSLDVSLLIVNIHIFEKKIFCSLYLSLSIVKDILLLCYLIFYVNTSRTWFIRFSSRAWQKDESKGSISNDNNKQSMSLKTITNKRVKLSSFPMQIIHKHVSLCQTIFIFCLFSYYFCYFLLSKTYQFDY